MAVGGVRLKAQKSKVEGLKEQIETLQVRLLIYVKYYECVRMCMCVCVTVIEVSKIILICICFN